jgi:hypothetical protein
MKKAYQFDSGDGEGKGRKNASRPFNTDGGGPATPWPDKKRPGPTIEADEDRNAKMEVAEDEIVFQTDNNFWDVAVDAIVISALIVGAVLTAPVSAPLAAGLAVCALVLTYLEYEDDREGNVFDHLDNLVTAVGSGVAVAFAWAGSLVGFGIAGSVAVLSQSSNILDWATSHSWFWLVVAAAVIFMWKKYGHMLPGIGTSLSQRSPNSSEETTFDSNKQSNSRRI